MKEQSLTNTKSTAVINGLLTVCFIVLVIASLYFEKSRLLDQLNVALNQHVIEVNKQLERLLFLPRVLATDPRFSELLAAHNNAEIYRWNVLLEQIKQKSNAAYVFILDGEGLAVASSNWGEMKSFVGEDYSFRPYFRTAREGQLTTYFAVGATTGQSGYFIANPIRREGVVLGVIVVKIHLDSLEDSWDRLNYDIALFDEMDVAIMSNRDDFLYVPFGQLSEENRRQIELEKRYPLQNNMRFDESRDSVVVHTSRQNKGFFSASKDIAAEPWKARLFYSRSAYWSRVYIYLATLSLVFLIMLLLVRIFRQQRLIAEVGREHARQLVRKVAERSRQLESTQQKLIVQSNYALLGKMSAAINHEINQPLTSLRFNLASLRQLLDEDRLRIDLVRQVVVESDLTTKRIGRVMETLRSVSKTSSTDFEPVDLNTLMIDSEKIVRRERPNTSRCLQRRTSEGVVMVNGNFILLQQALLNLLSNAFDAILEEEQPHVFMALECSEKKALLYVEDNGVGVSKQMTSRLFDEYTSSKSGASGLGLGLSLSSQIAVDHGGRLRYDPLPATGSRFSIELPLLTDVNPSNNEGGQST